MTRTMAPIARAAAPPRRRSSRAATAGPIDPLTRSGRENRPGPAQQASTEATWTRHNVPAMESPHSGHDADRSTQGQPHAGKAYLANDASALSRDLLGGEAEKIVGLAGVPCRIPGEMLGMLVVIHRRPHSWTVRDLGLATGLAGQLATALQNARLYASVRSLANRLTAIHELSLRLSLI